MWTRSIGSPGCAHQCSQVSAGVRLHFCHEPISVCLRRPTAGIPLRILLTLMESGVAGPIRRRLMRDNGFPQARSLKQSRAAGLSLMSPTSNHTTQPWQALEEQFIPEPPTLEPNTSSGWVPRPGAPSFDDAVLPLGTGSVAAAAAAAAALHALGEAGGGSSRVMEFHSAYKSGRLTPAAVAERLIAAVAESEAADPPLRCLIAFDQEHLRRQAAASTERWVAGQPLSVLDGVPFAVKVGTGRASAGTGDCLTPRRHPAAQPMGAALASPTPTPLPACHAARPPQDGLDAAPYPTTAGTAWMAEWRAITGTNPAVGA